MALVPRGRIGMSISMGIWEGIARTGADRGWAGEGNWWDRGRLEGDNDMERRALRFLGRTGR